MAHTAHEQIVQMERDLEAALQACHTMAELEAVKTVWLGRRDGIITNLMRTLKDVSLEEKRSIGPRIQELQAFAQERYTARHEELMRASQQRPAAPLDVTAYRTTFTHGSLHPLTHLTQRIEEVFFSLGYSLVHGPEVEDEWHNFEALNIPADHPARDLHDTFWLQLPGKLLRTHTSGVQVRHMEQYEPPLAMCAPGRVFRHEATDATHDFVFTQCEGLVVDKGISVAHLLGTIEQCMRLIFEHKTLRTRVRPSYYPFVEPGLDVDIQCPFCTSGCSICKHTRWIEVGGAGLVHPHVLRSCNLDPQIWSGFAFGFGIERLAMLLYHIDDVRLFKSGKLPFLEQFS